MNKIYSGSCGQILENAQQFSNMILNEDMTPAEIQKKIKSDIAALKAKLLSIYAKENPNFKKLEKFQVDCLENFKMARKVKTLKDLYLTFEVDVNWYDNRTKASISGLLCVYLNEFRKLGEYQEEWKKYHEEWKYNSYEQFVAGKLRKLIWPNDKSKHGSGVITLPGRVCIAFNESSIDIK